MPFPGFRKKGEPRRAKCPGFTGDLIETHHLLRHPAHGSSSDARVFMDSPPLCVWCLHRFVLDVGEPRFLAMASPEGVVAWQEARKRYDLRVRQCREPVLKFPPNLPGPGRPVTNLIVFIEPCGEYILDDQNMCDQHLLTHYGLHDKITELGGCGCGTQGGTRALTEEDLLVFLRRVGRRMFGFT